jgi:hypothetical protein
VRADDELADLASLVVLSSLDTSLLVAAAEVQRPVGMRDLQEAVRAE